MPLAAKEAKAPFSPEFPENITQGILPLPAGDGDAESSVVEVGMVHRQDKVTTGHQKVTSSLPNVFPCVPADASPLLGQLHSISPCKAALPLGNSPPSIG